MTPDPGATVCPDGHLSTSTDYCDVCGLAIAPADFDGGSGDEDATSPDLSPIPSSTQECPNCSAQNPPDALFCEACGYDYTTGTMPRPVEPLSFPMPGSLAGAGPSVESDVPDAAVDAGSDPAPDEDEGSPAVAAPAADLAPARPAAASAPPPSRNTAPALTEPWVVEVWIDPDWYAEQGSSERMPSPGLPTVVLLRHTSSLIGRTSRSRGISPDIDVSSDPGVSRRHAQLTTDGSRWFVEDLGSANGTFVGAASEDPPQAAIDAGDRREIASGEQVYLGAWTRLVIRRAADGEV